MSTRQINSKTTITRPGTYTLAQDIAHGGGTFLSEPCIRIEANDVVLDGGGFTIGGRGVSDTSGVVASDVRNVTVKNVTFSRWDYGVRFENVTGGRVRNVHAVNNGYGLSFKDAHVVLVSGSRVSKNVLGVLLDPPSNVFSWNNTVESNLGRDVYRSPIRFR